MKTIEVPLTVMGKRFVVPVRVRTLEDFSSLMDESRPLMKEKVTKYVENRNTVEAQRGNALVKLIGIFLSTLSAEKKGLINKKLAEVREQRDGLRNMKQEDPELWGDEFDEQIRNLEQEMQWYSSLNVLMAMPLPKTEDQPNAA